MNVKRDRGHNDKGVHTRKSLSASAVQWMDGSPGFSRKNKRSGHYTEFSHFLKGVSELKDRAHLLNPMCSFFLNKNYTFCILIFSKLRKPILIIFGALKSSVVLLFDVIFFVGFCLVSIL